MYAAQLESDAGTGPGKDGAGHWRAATLSHGQIITEDQSYLLRRTVSFRSRFDAWLLDASSWLDNLDIAPSLAENIGSRRWWRGLVTMLGLGAAAISFWPDFSPLEAAPAMIADAQVQDEFRSQAIMPLALGSDSGRHMAATQAVRKLAAAPERPQIQLVATLAKGDSFQRMLQRAGVGKGEAAQITGMIENAIATEDIEPGTQLDITLGGAPRQASRGRWNR